MKAARSRILPAVGITLIVGILMTWRPIPCLSESEMRHLSPDIRFLLTLCTIQLITLGFVLAGLRNPHR